MPTVKEYNALLKKASPPSPSGRNIPMAFLFGGGICLIGQLLIAGYKALSFSTDTAGMLCSITLVLCSTLLTGFHIYDDLAKTAGAGMLVPITGFANAMCSPAIEFKTEGFILGLGAKLFTIAGPVIAYGVLTSVGYGVLLCLFGRG